MLPFLICSSLFPSLSDSAFQNPGLPFGFKNARSIYEISQSISGHHHRLPFTHQRLHSLSNSTAARFLRGLCNLFLPVQNPVPQQDLNLGHNAQRKPPFELVATCSLHLSLKTSFLIAIISASPMKELGILMADCPYTPFCNDKVALRPHPHFLPKVSLEYYINQEIRLRVFYPKAHVSREETS